MTKSWKRSPPNSSREDSTETPTTPAPMSLGSTPRSRDFHVRYAKTGEQKANAVQPAMTVRLYTPSVSAAAA